MWEERLQELLAFRARHGHPNVPRRWVENPRLAHWVVNQRRLLRLGTLNPERCERLAGLGVSWPTAEARTQQRDREWDRMCERLAEHRRRHGDADLPRDLPGNVKLARWIVCQRHHLRRGTLREDRRQRLKDMGVDWSLERGRTRARDRAWDRLCGALAEFRREHGHSHVPKNWAGNPQLARWVIRQRHQFRTGPMPPDRRARLEELGVGRPMPPPFRAPKQPGRHEAAWQSLYESLAAFKKACGHCLLPRRWRWNPRLARWIHHQRELQRRGLLKKIRFDLLDRLGVQWIGAAAGPLKAASGSRSEARGFQVPARALPGSSQN